MRAISSFTPEEPAANSFAVCRRSWKCNPSGSGVPSAAARTRDADQARLKFDRRGVAPFGPTNTLPSGPFSDHLAR